MKNFSRKAIISALALSVGAATSASALNKVIKDPLFRKLFSKVTQITMKIGDTYQDYGFFMTGLERARLNIFQEEGSAIFFGRLSFVLDPKKRIRFFFKPDSFGEEHTWYELRGFDKDPLNPNLLKTAFRKTFVSDKDENDRINHFLNELETKVRFDAKITKEDILKIQAML